MPYVNVTPGSSKLSGVTVSGTAASGAVPVASSASAAAWAIPPGFELGYDQITSAVNVASTTEATGTTIISAAAHVFDGGPVLCTVFFPYVENGTVASSSVTVSLFEAATQIGRMGTLLLASGTLQEALTFHGVLRFTPTAASHTYTVTAFATSATGTPACGAGSGGTSGYNPAFVRFTKV